MRKKFALFICIFLLEFSHLLLLSGWAQENNTAADQAQNAVEQKVSAPPKAIRTSIDQIAFQDTDILDALNAIVQKTGVVITVSRDIRGRVTLNMENADVWDVLKIVCDMTGLAYLRDQDQVRIVTADEYEQQKDQRFTDQWKAEVVRLKYADPAEMVKKLRDDKSPDGKMIINPDGSLILLEKPEKLQVMLDRIAKFDVSLQTEVFALQFVKGEELLPELKKNLSADVGQINYDERSNKIVVTDKADQIEKIRSIIVQQDKKQEIFVKSQVVDVLLSDEHFRGVDWEAIVNEYGVLAPSQDKGEDAKRDLGVGTLSREDFSILLEALETVGLTKTYSTNNVLIPEKERQEIGVVSDDSNVFVKVKKEGDLFLFDSFFQSLGLSVKREAGQNFNLAIDSIALEGGQKIDLQIEKDQVIVIGGIFQEQTLEATRKIPFLGDLPFLGVMFRKQQTKMQRTERIIFLIPEKWIEHTQ